MQQESNVHSTQYSFKAKTIHNLKTWHDMTHLQDIIFIVIKMLHDNRWDSINQYKLSCTQAHAGPSACLNCYKATWILKGRENGSKCIHAVSQNFSTGQLPQRGREYRSVFRRDSSRILLNELYPNKYSLNSVVTKDDLQATTPRSKHFHTLQVALVRN